MKDYPEAEAILQSMGRRRLMEARRTNNPDSSDKKSGIFQADGQRPDSHRGNSDGRQRKKGISLAYLLKSKKGREFDSAANPPQKSPNVPYNAEGSKNSGSREQSFSELVKNFNHVRDRTLEDGKFLPKREDSPGMSSFMDRIMHKQNKMPPLPVKKKRSLWHKISRLVHLRHWRTSNLELVPEPSETKVNHCSLLQKPEIQSYQSSKRCLSPVENRRTSWQPSKPSVSNWNRSELFANSTEKDTPQKRRKTIADAGMLLKTTLVQEKPQKKLPGILMTGSGLNVKNDSPDISPMSSNYSLTPSTSEDENIEEEEELIEDTALQNDTTDKISLDKVPVLPSGSTSMEHFVTKLMCDFKATMDSYIAETERDMCLRILQLEEELKSKDVTIKDLQHQVIQQLQRNSAEIVDEPAEVEEQPVKETTPKPSPQNKISQDSAICSIDITTPSPQDTEVPPVHFDEEEMWLVEFPQNALTPTLTVKHPKLRRHSSVEVGREIPFRLTTQRSDDIFLRPAVPRDGATSPRRFSESQARPDVVLANSFADRVRRVFAKVKANRMLEDSEESSSPPAPFKWPLLTSKTRRSSTGSPGSDKQTRQQQMLQRHDETLDRGGESIKRLLPTIAESCSFDSLRESSMMELKLDIDPGPEVSTENKDSVVIDVAGTATEQNT